MQAIHGNPHYRPQLEQADITKQAAAPDQGKPAKGDMAGRTAVDQLDLSATAKQLVETTGTGKSGNSPAHQARAAVAAHPELAGLPFGQVVKAVNHGTLDSLVTPPAPETGEGEAVDPLATEGQADPAGIVASEDETPAVTDDMAPDEATESGNAVSTSGTDGAQAEENTGIMPQQIVAEIDTEASLLDVIDGAEDEPESQQAA